jgi:type I restriction enzyme S subunit
MNAARLLEHFHRISDAPDAIPRLRRFILDLAVRGKLVQQDPNDEPASELLKRIAMQKAQLVKAGEIRKPKNLALVDPDEIPLGSISGWVWTRLGDVSTLITKGSTPTSYGHEYTVEGINFIKVESIKNGQLLPANVTSFISSETNAFLARSRLAVDDILFSIAGSIGTCAVVTETILPANTNQALAIIRGTQTVFSSDFLLISLQSSVASGVRKKARGGAMNNISLEDIQNFVVPLPPIAEQRRIVAKVHELMALCDQLEAARAEREATRDRLAAASLARLNAPDPETFHDDARFALDALPALTTRPDQIKQLRQTILNLAVRGKLVPQDPKDEPASELLKRIAAEKARLVKAGEIRKEKPLQPIQLDAAPFDLPFGWAWARLGTIIHLVSGQHLQPPEYSEDPKSGLPYITGPSDFGANGLEITRFALVRKAVARRGQLLLTVKGSGVGKATTCDIEEVAISRQLMALTAIGWERRFLVLVTHRLAETLREQARSLIPGISREDVDEFVVGVPPLAEQHRIVTKVDELMALCNRLEASLATGDDTRRRLLDALIAEVLARGESIVQEEADQVVAYGAKSRSARSTTSRAARRSKGVLSGSQMDPGEHSSAG